MRTSLVRISAYFIKDRVTDSIYTNGVASNQFGELIKGYLTALEQARVRK